MINVNRDLSITMVQGDKGGIEFSLDCIKLNEGDKVCLTVTDNSIKFKVYGIVSEGIAYIVFEKNMTINLDVGLYDYSIHVKTENGIDYTVVSSKLKLERGFVCE